MNLDPHLVLDGEWGWLEMESFDFELGLSGSIDMNVWVRSTNGVHFHTGVQLLELQKFFFFFIGPLPVAGKIELEIKAGIWVEGPGGFQGTLGGQVAGSTRLGGHWTDDGGWTPVAEGDLSAEAYEPDFTIRDGLFIRPYVRVAPAIKFYGVAGPGVRNDLFLSDVIDPTCEGIDWDLDAGFWSSGFLKFDILDKWKPTKFWPFYEWRADIADGHVPWPADLDIPFGLCDGDAPMCEATGMMECDRIVGGDTTGGADAMSAYPCNVGDYTGPEEVWEWTAPFSGPVEWKLVDPTPTELDQDVLVLDASGGCAAEQCVTWGGNSTTFDAVAGQTYRLVVDGYDGAAGPYQAALDCSP